MVARIEPGDIGEDQAAADIAQAAAGNGVRVDRAFTGRANLFAETSGVLAVDKDSIDRLNLVDEAITFATLAAFSPVVEGQMIATAKIIPFAVSDSSHDAALTAAKSSQGLVRIAPYCVKKIGIVSTRLPGLAEKVIEKTVVVTRNRLAASNAEVVSGVGGLLMEIVTRPQPREEPPAKTASNVAAIVLAAGRSSRMGARNKLLEKIGGVPLIRVSVDATLASRASPVIVVTGHDNVAIRAALSDLTVQFVHNPDYPEGLSTSIRAGIGAIPRRFFPELLKLEGDMGARRLASIYSEGLVEVETGDDGAFFDIDTPDELGKARA